MLVRWTEVHVKQTDSEQADLKRLLEGKEMPEFTPEFSFSYSSMVFNINDVVRFNKSQDDKCTTLRMRDGDTFVVAVDYEVFRELYISATGHNIHSFVEKEKKVKISPKKGPSNSENTSKSSGDFDINSI